MKIAAKRIPKLAATSLMLAGCGDDGSVSEKFFVEEIDVLATEYCTRVADCYGGHEEFGLAGPGPRLGLAHGPRLGHGHRLGHGLGPSHRLGDRLARTSVVAAALLTAQPFASLLD